MRWFPGSVAGSLDRPLIVLFKQQCPDEADNGGFVREEADDLAAALDLAIESLEWVGAVYLGAMPCWGAHVNQHIGFGVVNQSSEPTDARLT